MLVERVPIRTCRVHIERRRLAWPFIRALEARKPLSGDDDYLQMMMMPGLDGPLELALMIVG